MFSVGKQGNFKTIKRLYNRYCVKPELTLSILSTLVHGLFSFSGFMNTQTKESEGQHYEHVTNVVWKCVRRVKTEVFMVTRVQQKYHYFPSFLKKLFYHNGSYLTFPGARLAVRTGSCSIQ